MISRIDQPPNLPKVPVDPRKTEDSDTRQALQRHDPEFYKKKDDDKDRPGFRDPYEDLADVSVPALRNFLLGLLDKIGASEHAPSAAGQGSAEPARPASSPQAAAAVSAYQSGARRGVSAPPPVSPPPSDAPAPTALDQAAAGLDRATLLDLIRDLDRLYAEGVTAITLEKGESFLDSIRAGIARARGI